MAKKAAATKSKTDAAGKPLRLVLLDSHAILHRAYHALPDFSSSKGEPTGALYGLILMLLKINESLKPDYLIAARDLAGKTVRHEKFEAYKATRMKADDELIAQLIRAPQVFEAFGVPVYSSEGYEADDVIGTIVRALRGRRDVEVIIATGDMDTLQLVGDNVRVFTLRKGLTDTVIYDEQAVHDRFGFGPEHIVDYKALRGDPSDNIPGVRGIGEKTATELIKHFGTIRSLYDALAKDPKIVEKKGVKPRIVQLLLEQKAEAAFSRELAEIEQNAPLVFALPKTHWHLKEHDGSIAHLLDELEFRSLRARLGFPAQAADAGGAEIAGIAVDQKSLEETSVALWLLRSDMTTPTLADILHFGNTQDFGRARERIFEELRATGRLIGVYEEIERPLIPVVQRMNATGIRLDTNYLGKLSKEYGAELQAVAGRIYKHAGHEFNINSPKQLEGVLYDELKISLPRQKKTATGARTTREEELAKMVDMHPVIADVLAYRELQKLLGTYIEKMPKLIGEDGRLHTKFEQAGTTTGRMSCRDPNLQNIPIKSENGRRIRGAFIADKGCALVAIDYSQIELRVAAGLSGDKKLISIFREGGDVHTAVASQVFAVPPEHVDYEMRRRAKVINFGILYGMGVNALRANLGPDVGRDEAALFLSEYFKNFSGLAHFIEKTKADAARLGYTETLYGRRRYFPAFKSALPNLRAQAERMAINAPIQGTQADIIKRAMFEADTLIEKEGWRSEVRLLLQVHDELVYEIASDKAESIARRLRDVMEGIVETKLLSGVPIIAEIAIGPNWGAVERIAR